MRDEDAAHRLCGNGQKMRAAGELRVRLRRELHVCFVDERGRAERVTRALDGELPVRDQSELLVQKREERFGRRGVALPWHGRRAWVAAIPVHAAVSPMKSPGGRYPRYRARQCGAGATPRAVWRLDVRI